MGAENLHWFKHKLDMFVEEEFSAGTKYSEFVRLRKSLGLRLLEAEGMFSGSIVCVCPVHLHLHQGWGDLGHACGNALVVGLQLQAAGSRQQAGLGHFWK